MTDGPEVGAAGVRAGDVLAGKYRVDRVLGVGGMGVVVAAHHLQLDERVAIKFLLPQAMGSPEAVTRFDREARAAVKIKSEHVARVIDVGTLENGSPYMVMEYLDGKDLSSWLAQHGPLPSDQAVDFVLQACEAIAEAHSLGIVHRDLKPANLFCIRRPEGALAIKVLDFGISKLGPASPGSGMAMTRTQAIMGSPLYMSPEQMESSKGVDPRADIWAIGVILYELLSGHTPFHGEAITELVLRIVTATPASVRSLRPDVPPGLEPVIMRCLEKDRERRYANVGELAMALADFAPPAARLSVDRIVGLLRAVGVVARPSMVSSAEALPPPHGMTAASWGQTGAGVKRGAPVALWVSVGVLGVLIAVGATALVLRGNAASKSAAASTPSEAAAPPAAISVPGAAPPAVAPSAVPEATLAPAPDESAPDAAAAPAPAAPSAARSGSVARPVAAGPAAPAAVPSAGGGAGAGKRSCDPPYFIDSAGHRRYKPECL